MRGAAATVQRTGLSELEDSGVVCSNQGSPLVGGFEGPSHLRAGVVVVASGAGDDQVGIVGRVEPPRSHVSDEFARTGSSWH